MSRLEKKAEGIYRSHARSCDWQHGNCSCAESYQAAVWSRRDGKLIRKHFDKLPAAKTWREDVRSALRQGTMRAPTRTKIGDAADRLLAGMADGTIRNRKGEVYKPSAIRSYRRAIELRIRPRFGHVRLDDLRRADVQDFIEDMLGMDMSVSTIKNTLDPLRVIYRRAIQREEVVIDPLRLLEVPMDRGRRDRVASPAEAAELISALPEEDRALWATALYVGLRRGELRELRWSDVDLAAGIISVQRTLDDGERGRPGEVAATKTRAGEREVPILPLLREELTSHKMLTGRDGNDLVFGRTATLPFIPSTVRRRARKAWERADLAPIALHECRHTAASVMREAGIDDKLRAAILGHSSVVITQDRYTHVDRGHLVGAATQLDAFLAETLAG